MTVVSDAGPIHYLVLIDAMRVLEQLYGRVVVPETVANELTAARTPNVVRSWIEQPPLWLEMINDPPHDPRLFFLDPGERAAIVLAELMRADRLLIDDWDGRSEAKRRGLLVTGTLGVLAEAHKQKLLDFELALERLQQTNF